MNAAMFPQHVFTLLTQEGESDVRAAAISVDLPGVRVLVLDLPALIAAKRTAGRTKDLLALPQIEAVLRLRESEKSGSGDAESETPEVQEGEK